MHVSDKRIRVLLGSTFFVDLVCTGALVLFLHCGSASALFSFKDCGGLELVFVGLRTGVVLVVDVLSCVRGKCVPQV